MRVAARHGPIIAIGASKGGRMARVITYLNFMG